MKRVSYGLITGGILSLLLIYAFAESQQSPTQNVSTPKAESESTEPKSLTGKILLNDCKLALNIIDEKKSKETVENMSKAMFCAGFIYGFASGESISSQYLFQQSKEAKEHKQTFNPEKNSIAFCMPFEISNEENVRNVVKFLEENPAYQEKPASFAIWQALSKAHPCP